MYLRHCLVMHLLLQWLQEDRDLEEVILLFDVNVRVRGRHQKFVHVFCLWFISYHSLRVIDDVN